MEQNAKIVKLVIMLIQIKFVKHAQQIVLVVQIKERLV